MNSEEQWNEIYSKEDFNPVWARPENDNTYKKIIREAVAGFTSERIRVLDIGCGNGRNSMIFETLSTPGVLYTGIDISAAAISYCEKHYTKDKKFFINDMTAENNDFNFCVKADNSAAPEKFDLLLDFGCFHSIPPVNRKKYIDTISLLCHHKTLFILATWFKKHVIPGTTESRSASIITESPDYAHNEKCYPYLILEEWIFTEGDMRDIFKDSFELLSCVEDPLMYPASGISMGYFKLKFKD